MGKRRTIKGPEFPHRKDDQGRPLCRFCGALVIPPRRAWCSKKCVDGYLALTDWRVIRRRIRKRDKGVCAACSCDTNRLRRVLKHIARRDYVGLLRSLGFNPKRSLWEADHIVEVVRGGTNDLSNLATLCVPCHKAKTREFARVRAQERRESRPIEESYS